MCVQDSRCQLFITLDLFGTMIQGCLRDIEWIKSLDIPCYQSASDKSFYIDLPKKKLKFLRNVSHGAFGFIDIALYDTDNEVREVYVKRPIVNGKNLLLEACIQKMVGEKLKIIGFPTGAPKVLEIFKLNDGSICFAMEPIDKAITLDRYLEHTSSNNIPSVLVECLLQLSSIMWYLSNMIGIDHRDLKPSNFLIVEHDQPISKILTIDTEIIEIESKYSLTLIDFGFSCIGSTETRITDISLSSVYSKKDPCPKDGRDMYLFIGLVYIDFHERLPPDLRTLFESWLDVPYTNLSRFIRIYNDKEYAKFWLYFIAGNEAVIHYPCSPTRILNDLYSIKTS